MHIGATIPVRRYANGQTHVHVAWLVDLHVVRLTCVFEVVSVDIVIYLPVESTASPSC